MVGNKISCLETDCNFSNTQKLYTSTYEPTEFLRGKQKEEGRRNTGKEQQGQRWQERSIDWSPILDCPD